MTVEQQSGRAILVLCLVVFSVLSLGTLLWDLLAVHSGQALTQALLVALMIGLFAWLLGGSSIARWLVVALLALGGGLDLAVSFAGSGLLLTGLLGLVYLGMAAVVAMSSSVTTFLAYQRRRRARAA